MYSFLCIYRPLHLCHSLGFNRCKSLCILHIITVLTVSGLPSYWLMYRAGRMMGNMAPGGEGGREDEMM